MNFEKHKKDTWKLEERKKNYEKSMNVFSYPIELFLKNKKLF